ncbi:hypothetical protein [Planococcus lenghuensis]|uniref:Uncharacterized protein n=1 Tax=Planococcus lenghuensis TaxID=2213202 RepID=A0A1Q2L5C7_9BACL|nr:hypothetical protein [Planococcus lenghuensis]AQQ55574.1 hypothetical protein B0X71_20590 [Planococcus lenghuensis]
MMKRLPTVEEAKQEIQFLQQFVQLAEAYGEETLEKRIIKLYAIHGSIKTVTEVLNAERANQQEPIETSVVRDVIQSKASDPLHQLIRSHYLKKTRHMRKKTTRKVLW